MRMDHNKYMTDRVCKAHGCDKNTLFHYDNIGLFYHCGYRWLPLLFIYQMEYLTQLYHFERDGHAVKWNQEFMDHRSPESLMELFEKRIKITRTDQTGQIPATVYPWQKKEKMKESGSIDFEHVFRKQFPNRYYDCRKSEDMKRMQESLKRRMNLSLNSSAKLSDGLWDRLYPEWERHSVSVYDNYTNAVILPFKKPKGMDYQILKAGEYLTGYHKGRGIRSGPRMNDCWGIMPDVGEIKIDHIFRNICRQ